MTLCVTAIFSGKMFFAPQNWEIGPEVGQKQDF